MLTTSILGQLQWFQQHGRQVTLHWIPSDVGIPGNEWADEAAKAALRFREIQVQVPPSISQIKNGIQKSTQSTISTKLLDIARAGSASANWYLVATRRAPVKYDRLSRQKMVNLFRLRLGYKCTWQILQDAPIRECIYCQEPAEAPLDHYLLDCEVTRELRELLGDWDEDQYPNPSASLVYALQDKQYERLVQVVTRYPPPR